MVSKAAARRALPVLFAIVAGTQALAQQKQANVFTVANVRAEAEAANAVEAKKLATQMAEKRAFRLLVSRLVDFRAQQSVPDLPIDEIERLVSDIEIRGEGVSSTGYVASFGITFSERAAGAFLARYKIVPILDRGPEILIVPVFIEDGAAVTSANNPWRSAFLSLDLVHALVPAKVAPARGDITAAIANAFIANPPSAVETLKAQYHTPEIVFAVASAAGGDEVALKLIGNDVAGPLTMQRKVKVQDAGEDPLLKAAARLAFDTLQQRWKLTRDTFVAAGADNATGNPAAGAGYSGGYMSGGVASLVVTAQYSGLKEWNAIRTRLQNIPGIQNWELRGVNPRAAQIAFDFPGGAERLSVMAAGQGLSVETGPEGLVVKTR
jgi:hypothetical protein